MNNYILCLRYNSNIVKREIFVKLIKCLESFYPSPVDQVKKRQFIKKNVSSSTSHKKLLNSKTVRLRDFSFYLSSTFIYEPILIQIYMNSNIMNTQISYLNKYDL